MGYERWLYCWQYSDGMFLYVSSFFLWGDLSRSTDLGQRMVRNFPIKIGNRFFTLMVSVVCFETAHNWFSYICRYTLQKIPSKNFHFFWSKKYFKKKVAKKSNFGNKINFSFVKLMDFVDKNLIFSKKHAFFEKNENQLFFWKYFFDQKKWKIFDQFFLKNW